jgi:predicted  nucleic acid-binding Zn-ribbon protein
MDTWRNRMDILVENFQENIQEDIETEVDESITSINNTLEILTDEISRVKTDVLSFNNAVEANFAKIYNDISSIRNNQQAPTQDIDRY